MFLNIRVSKWEANPNRWTYIVEDTEFSEEFKYEHNSGRKEFYEKFISVYERRNLNASSALFLYFKQNFSKTYLLEKNSIPELKLYFPKIYNQIQKYLLLI